MSDIVIFCLGSAVLILIALVCLIGRGRRAAQQALIEASRDYAATITNTRQQAYMDGVAQAERESKQAFQRGLTQGEQRAIQALMDDIKQDGLWN